MKRIILMLLAVIILAGCKANITGTYVDEKNPQNSFELKSGGTFLIHQAELSKSGKYVIDGKNVILTLDSGGTARGKIEGKTFIDNGGGRFTKK